MLQAHGDFEVAALFRWMLQGLGFFWFRVSAFRLSPLDLRIWRSA